jgi:hypothetical protein
MNIKRKGKRNRKKDGKREKEKEKGEKISLIFIVWSFTS